MSLSSYGSNASLPELPPLPQDDVDDAVMFARVLYYDNPFSRLMKETDRALTKQLNKEHNARDLLKLPDISNYNWKEFTDFLQDVFSMQWCSTFDRDYISDCKCLQNPEISLPDSVSYLLDYCQTWKSIRQTLLKEKLRSAHLIKKLNRLNRNHKTQSFHYAAPIGVDRGDVFICVHAFRFLFCIGRSELNSLKENAMSGIPGPIRHGNVDMPNRASGLNYLAAVESCRMFLQELQDEHGEAMATRLVRESVSSVSRGDSHITHLPSSYTKR